MLQHERIQSIDNSNSQFSQRPILVKMANSDPVWPKIIQTFF